ncbi:glucan biosynthesis protein [Vulcaniibacterium tengchongense]|uniref:Glucans biosynthesis protein D n=1 Tax=Vulcaniibacterium tengchongense TaxID=1273429 RepID=A0A3N4W7J3_9GAMM|nr:glucan biosynthesis protein [Vulcaniibacterium tengchongense]RPE81184.1 glucans biosynthesis protein [Vulcaniibacterium tengchongense]
MRRREVLLAGSSWPLLALFGAARSRASAAARPFAGAEHVADRARALAARPYRPPSARLPAWLQQLSYDEYRDIRFDPARALWRGRGLPFQAQFFHRGYFFRERVELYEAADGTAVPLRYAPAQFEFDGLPRPGDEDLGYAGFRLHAPLNRADRYDELCAFLGASYFRAVVRGLAYGLSARGLALRTGDPAGEEFPVFRAFWLERPAPGAAQAVVHALLDGPSAAGAFRLAIRPGVETTFDVNARLFPRVELHAVGIAPLTSMFQFDAHDRDGVDDFRAAVHDSDGLALHTGAGEQVWRPLHNPRTLQESAFAGRAPRAFGLMQRKRAFADYADSEAQYERRPSLWVEPQGDWGEGAVHLFELPTADEFHDNIVAFWRPRAPLAAGREHRFDYRLHWCGTHAWRPELARVRDTRIGAGYRGTRRVVIDYAGGRLPREDGAAVLAEVAADRGRALHPDAYPLRDGGWRLTFELDPDGARTIELRALLRDAAGPLSETWLYRWTA